MMSDCSAIASKLVLDFNLQNIFQDAQISSEQVKILDCCNQIILEEKMAILSDHCVTYTKNIHFGTSNLRVPYSGVYGPDGI